MKTIVLIKQVPMAWAMELDPETKTLKREGVKNEVSSFDVRALLKALELREEHGGEVVALTMGPPQAREALEHCLALGADRGIQLSDPAFAGADTLATARALALAIAREGYDLVLCGRHSTDAETGQVGPEVAELAGIPQVTGARSLEVDAEGRLLTIERETDAGTETVECPLPALVSATEDLAPERFPLKADRERARDKPIEVWSANDLFSDLSIFGAAGSPTWVSTIETVEVERQQRVLEGELDAQVGEPSCARLWAARRSPPPARSPISAGCRASTRSGSPAGRSRRSSTSRSPCAAPSSIPSASATPAWWWRSTTGGARRSSSTPTPASSATGPRSCRG